MIPPLCGGHSRRTTKRGDKCSFVPRADLGAQAALCCFGARCSCSRSWCSPARPSVAARHRLRRRRRRPSRGSARRLCRGSSRASRSTGHLRGSGRSRRGRARSRPSAATARPTSPARTSCRRATARARPSRSSTPTTTRTPRATSPPTAASSACRRARRPTAASGRSTRTAPRARCRPRTPAGRGDRARHRDGLGGVPAVQDPARRGEQRLDREPRHRGEPGGRAWAPSPCRTATAGPRARATRAPYTSYYKHPGVAITVSSRRQRLRRRVTRAARRTSPRSAAPRSTPPRTRAAGPRRHGPAPAAAARRTRRSRRSRHDTGCARRTVADVSAVADPNTGVAVYDSYGSRRLDRLRRHERLVADHRRGLRARPAAGSARLPGLVPVRPHRARCST